MSKRNDDIWIWEYEGYCVQVHPCQPQGWGYTVTVEDTGLKLHSNPNDVAYVTPHAARYYGIEHYKNSIGGNDVSK